MQLSTIYVMLGIVVLFFLFGELYLKRKLKIRPTWMNFFTKGRKRVFVVVEWIILLSFIFSFTALYTLDRPVSIRLLPMFLMFFLFELLRGFELWLTNRKERSYLHEWLGSFTILLAYGVLLVSEV